MKALSLTLLLLVCCYGNTQTIAQQEAGQYWIKPRIISAHKVRLFRRTSSQPRSSIGSRSHDRQSRQESNSSKVRSGTSSRSHSSNGPNSSIQGGRVSGETFETESHGQSTVQSPPPPRRRPRYRVSENLPTPPDRSPSPSYTSSSSRSGTHSRGSGSASSSSSISSGYDGASPSPGSSENSSRRIPGQEPVEVEAELTGPAEIFIGKGRATKGLAWHKVEAGKTKEFIVSHPDRVSSEIRVHHGGSYMANSIGHRAWAGAWTTGPQLRPGTGLNQGPAQGAPSNNHPVQGASNANQPQQGAPDNDPRRLVLSQHPLHGSQARVQSYGHVQKRKAFTVYDGRAVMTKGTAVYPDSRSGAFSAGVGKGTGLIAAANFGVPINRGEPRYSYEVSDEDNDQPRGNDR